MGLLNGVYDDFSVFFCLRFRRVSRLLRYFSFPHVALYQVILGIKYP